MKDHVGKTDGCLCDPPGSGEEYCVGTCFQRAEAQRYREALEVIRQLAVSKAVYDIAREALEAPSEPETEAD